MRSRRHPGRRRHRHLALVTLAALCTLAVVAAPAEARRRQRAKPKPHPLPWVGELQAYDAKGSVLTLLGPDGKTFTVHYPHARPLLREREAALPHIEIAKLAKGPAPATMAAFLRDESTAYALFLVDVADPVSAYLTRIDEPTRQLFFNHTEGFQVRATPAVNLGGRDSAEAAVETTSWEWFEQRLQKPLAFREFSALGFTYVWSVAGWDPSAADDPDADATREEE